MGRVHLIPTSPLPQAYFPSAFPLPANPLTAFAHCCRNRAGAVAVLTSGSGATAPQEGARGREQGKQLHVVVPAPQGQEQLQQGLELMPKRVQKLRSVQWCSCCGAHHGCHTCTDTQPAWCVGEGGLML